MAPSTYSSLAAKMAQKDRKKAGHSRRINPRKMGTPSRFQQRVFTSVKKAEGAGGDLIHTL
jgi:hypothetical protein